MEEHLQKTVDVAMEKLRGLEREVAETKKFINSVRALGGAEPMFAITDEPGSTATLTTIKADTFYGQPFATAVTTYLRMRKSKDLGPATVAEIHEALRNGGYQFDAKNDDYAKRGIRHSLSKNTQTFHRLPNGSFGLLEWYPEVKKKPAKPMVLTMGDDEDDADEDDDVDENDGADDDEDDESARAPKNGSAKGAAVVNSAVPTQVKFVRRNPTIKAG